MPGPVRVAEVLHEPVEPLLAQLELGVPVLSLEPPPHFLDLLVQLPLPLVQGQFQLGLLLRHMISALQLFVQRLLLLQSVLLFRVQPPHFLLVLGHLPVFKLGRKLVDVLLNQLGLDLVALLANLQEFVDDPVHYVVKLEHPDVQTRVHLQHRIFLDLLADVFENPFFLDDVLGLQQILYVLFLHVDLGDLLLLPDLALDLLGIRLEAAPLPTRLRTR